jgi:DNA-binding protein Fis
MESGRKKINAAKYRQRRAEKIKEDAQKYHNSLYFDGLKYRVLERDHFRCVKCGDDKRDKLIIHHKDETGLSTVGEREYVNNDFDNLITLCRSCHIKVHHPDPANKKHISKEEVISSLEGRTIEQAAVYLGVTRKTLLLKRKQFGLELREQVTPVNPRKFILTAGDIEKVIQSSNSLDEAAKMLGVSRATLTKRRKEYGLPMRR